MHQMLSSASVDCLPALQGTRFGGTFADVSWQWGLLLKMWCLLVPTTRASWWRVQWTYDWWHPWFNGPPPPEDAAGLPPAEW